MFNTYTTDTYTHDKHINGHHDLLHKIETVKKSKFAELTKKIRATDNFYMQGISKMGVAITLWRKLKYHIIER